MAGALVVALGLALLVIIVLSRTAVVVPQQSAFVVEQLGRYRATLDAGFHILLPFVDAIRYRHSLKENALDIPEQICITKDNVQVHVDGVLYLKVMNPERASDGVSDYLFAINSAEGAKQQVIKASEAKKQQQINEAEGQAAAILAVAEATSEGIRKVAEAINLPGGYEAVQLRVAEQYIGQFGQLAKESNTMVLPASVADVGSMIALAMNVIGRRPDGPGRAGA